MQYCWPSTPFLLKCVAHLRSSPLLSYIFSCNTSRMHFILFSANGQFLCYIGWHACTHACMHHFRGTIHNHNVVPNVLTGETHLIEHGCALNSCNIGCFHFNQIALNVCSWIHIPQIVIGISRAEHKSNWSPVIQCILVHTLLCCVWMKNACEAYVLHLWLYIEIARKHSLETR